MFGSSVLEIAIGLVTTYLCLSLVVTAANELIATLCRSRARDLERGIGNILDGNSKYLERWWQTLIGKLKDREPLKQGTWAAAFFNHQLINALSKDDQCPSYIPSSTFAVTLMQLVNRAAADPAHDPNHLVAESADAAVSGLATFDQLRGTIAKIDNLKVREALLALLETARAEATADVDAMSRFNGKVEAWFDQVMARVGGWYKRRTQWFLFTIALVAAVLLNVDTVAICRRLGQDDTLKAALVESAKRYAATTPVASPTGSIDCVQQLLIEFHFPYSLGGLYRFRKYVCKIVRAGFNIVTVTSHAEVSFIRKAFTGS